MKATMVGKRYDVVIVEIATRKVSAIIGNNLTEDKAEKRLELGLSRINENFFVATVPKGRFRVGDKHRVSV